MRSFRLGFRRLVTSSLYAALLVGCAQGGLADENVSAAHSEADADDDGDDGSDGAGGKDAKDAGSASGRGTVDSGPKKDTSSTSRGGSDASRPSTGRTDAGVSALPTIKCPSNLVCTADVSVLLSVLDPSVKADTPVCVQSGVIPMAVSCKSDDECKSARLSSAKCTGSFCIQACSK